MGRTDETVTNERARPKFARANRRSSAARASFEEANPCPATGKTAGPSPGYVIDHIRPLKRGGPDAPSNMQWQTTSAAKAKDKVE